MPRAIFFIFLIGGSVALSAERALPGEVLYHWKTDVNERLALSVRHGAERKALFAATLAARRMEEAEILAVEKKLGSTSTSMVALSFKRSMKEVERRLVGLKKDGKLAVAHSIESGLEAALRAHEEVLTKLGEKEVAPSGLGAVLGALRSRIIQVELTRSDSERKLAESLPEQPSLEGPLKSAEAAYRDAEAYVAAAGERAGEEAMTEANARLAASSSAIADGLVREERKEYRAALAFYQSAARLAEEARFSADIASSVERRIAATKGPFSADRLGFGTTTPTAKAFGL